MHVYRFQLKWVLINKFKKKLIDFIEMMHVKTTIEKTI